MSLWINGPDGNHLGAVAREGDAAVRGRVLKTTAQNNQVKEPDLAVLSPQAKAIVVA
jgi:hypothetical protein